LGELIRIGLMRKAGQPSATTLATILIEKALDLLAAALVALALFVFTTAPAWAQEPVAGIALMGLSIGLGLSLMWVGRRWLERVSVGLGRVLPRTWQQRFQRTRQQMISAFSNVTGGAALLKILFWTLTIWTFSILSIVSLFLAFDLHLRLEAIIIMTLAANFSNIAPSPGLVGVVPVVAVIILDYFAVSQSLALSYGLALNLVMVGPLLVLGGWALWYRAIAVMDLLVFQRQFHKS
ncbi:MAG: flippase-like domain-containing protein, partial [Anaerolineae bacterium]|nr:flippase-like domain-containing protein [Anaerolineae bacterium]